MNVLTLFESGGKAGTTAAGKKLPRSQELSLLSALDILASGMIITDAGGRITFLNAAAQMMTAWTAEEAIGHTLPEMFGPTFFRENTAVLAEWRESLKAGPLRARGLFFLKNHLGEQFLMEDRTEIMPSNEDDRGGNVLQLRAVSAAEAHLLASRVMSEKLDSLGRLARGFAHDFNNVLTVLLGHLSLAEARLDKGEESQADLRTAREAALKAKNFVQQLSVFARGGSPVREKIVFSSWLEKFSARAAVPAHIQVQVQSEKLPPLLWDPSQLQRLLTNLLDNSIQAIGKREGAVAINLRRATSGELALLEPPLKGSYQPVALLEIRDDGHGIAPEHLNKIFDPYFSTNADGNASGIGLTVCKAIVKAHQGRILVTSEPQAGTLVRIYFPIKEAKAVRPLSSSRRQQQQQPVQETTRPPRVLVLEDEALIRRLIKVSLQSGGFLVEETEDGHETVRKYGEELRKGQRYDLVIMDLHIPCGLGGMAAMAELRKMDPEVRALVSSGYYDDPVMANYQDYGFSATLPKPYEPAKLLVMVRELTARKEELQNPAAQAL